MDRRYQVFVSSTYEDLKDERAEAIQALLELDCMPAGMELFPAANDEQWSWIKKIIDDSDYYVVIVGGRYGNTHPQTAVSYTEMEYRYAIQQKKPTLAFLHQDPGSISQDKSEKTEAGRERLREFRELCEQKLCKYWNSPQDLAAKLSRGMTQIIKHEPRPGWVQANNVSETQKIALLQLREENRRLNDELAAIRKKQNLEQVIACGSDLFEMNFCCEMQRTKLNKNGKKYWVSADEEWVSLSATWDQILYALIPALTTSAEQSRVTGRLNYLGEGVAVREIVTDPEEKKISSVKIARSDLDQIRLQFVALELIELEEEGYQTYWYPTDAGMKKIFELGALKKGQEQTRSIRSIAGPTADEEDVPPEK